jgi:hypothetical protein
MMQRIKPTSLIPPQNSEKTQKKYLKICDSFVGTNSISPSEMWIA